MFAFDLSLRFDGSCLAEPLDAQPTALRARRMAVADTRHTYVLHKRTPACTHARSRQFNATTLLVDYNRRTTCGGFDKIGEVIHLLVQSPSWGSLEFQIPQLKNRRLEKERTDYENCCVTIQIGQAVVDECSTVYAHFKTTIAFVWMHRMEADPILEILSSVRCTNIVDYRPCPVTDDKRSSGTTGKKNSLQVPKNDNGKHASPASIDNSWYLAKLYNAPPSKPTIRGTAVESISRLPIFLRPPSQVP
ncbi:hypothetical protein EW146_g4068 [Bondarzewia mesenterica]|uniref:Uncharacterized protein n=1 Tax=Bondarzewia mesenterica TaxID=1095465 RepID=A0A4S4LWR5_9AGAM|nr:hypothetical protein EW146_g4068 [Bondarzewia mesenterica]